MAGDRSLSPPSCAGWINGEESVFGVCVGPLFFLCFLLCVCVCVRA